MRVGSGRPGGRAQFGGAARPLHEAGLRVRREFEGHGQQRGDLARRAAGVRLDLADHLRRAADLLGQRFLRQVQGQAALPDPRASSRPGVHSALLFARCTKLVPEQYQPVYH